MNISGRKIWAVDPGKMCVLSTRTSCQQHHLEGLEPHPPSHRPSHSQPTAPAGNEQSQLVEKFGFGWESHIRLILSRMLFQNSVCGLMDV